MLTLNNDLKYFERIENITDKKNLLEIFKKRRNLVVTEPFIGLDAHSIAIIEDITKLNIQIDLSSLMSADDILEITMNVDLIETTLIYLLINFKSSFVDANIFLPLLNNLIELTLNNTKNISLISIKLIWLMLKNHDLLLIINSQALLLIN
ncbi:hypothetical protein TCON_0567 [Astathelohania contejeani]|uniref:Uncharacterized protein n=1 Tax=Astathelohania contejeani TaxID=164912 RepID=A0ABQ7I1J1_9MICR|nr:hypothetical protein TCON_0567 [Thelohania contejeani]